ncbi:MAG: InlB B-repeat-containing protein [Mangrovibacterium sp.]
MEAVKVNLLISSTVGGKAIGAGDYEIGSEVELKALPIEGYTFVHWQDQAGNIMSTNAYHTFIIKEDTKISATFALKKFSVRLTTIGEGIGTVSGDGEYDLGKTVELVAQAGINSEFVAWLDNDGNEVSKLYRHIFVIEKDTELKAQFDIVKHDITVSKTGGGTVSGSKQYVHGSTATLIAVAEIGYEFDKWTDNAGVTLSTNSTYSFTVDGDRNINCVFKKKTYTVKFNNVSSSSFTITMNGGNPIVWGKSYSFSYGETLHVQSRVPLVIANYPYEEVSGSAYNEYDYYIEVKENMNISIELIPEGIPEISF